MLASPSRRHHLQQPRHASIIPSPCSTQHLSYQQAPQHIATQQYYDSKLLNDYLDSQQPSYNTSTVNIASNPYMTTSYADFANPSIRVQQSTPTPQLQSSAFPQTPMNDSAWNSYTCMQSQSLQTPVKHQNKDHQRISSSSSTGSNLYQPFPNHLPTPSQTPTRDSFMGQSGYNNTYGSNSANMDNTMAAHMGIKEALMDGEDVPEFAHSARQSVSSYGQDSPTTPRTTQGDESDFKPAATEARPITIPKFERTYTDIAADNFYDPNAVVAQPQPESKPSQSSLLSPYRSHTTDVQRALKAAQYARSHSPTSQASRGTSPFRRGSPYHQPSSTFNSPIVGTASAAREQSRQADAAYAMKSQTQPSGSQPETISPKDALLDYREADEDSKVPLFSDSGAAEYDSQYNSGDQYRNATQSSFDTTSAQSFRRDSWATPQFSPNFPSSSAQSIPASQTFSFITPSNIPNLPLASTSQYRVAPNTMSSTVDQTPEFPAHLTSMESSASEAEPPNGSQSSVNERYLHKPTSSNADTGTYSCTYHGCSQRFETPQKLQKHKREGHRNANVGPNMTSEAILDRNTQAGPHKCERINPTTGKPCNTIFSRPYDLTRHEDTIHNARKQKVRCALCTEEKTFSRNDALTRHMRVVHPEVDFPGKHRRRGGNHD